MPERSESTSPETESAELGTLCHPFTTSSLFQGSREIFIEHAGEMYRLTITRNGKLILQK